MAKITKTPRSSSSRSFTLGRSNFSKISAVEGIWLDRDMVRTFDAFDEKKLSPKARREALIGMFGSKR